MRFKTGLRSRIILVFVGLSFVLGLLIIIGVIVSTSISETRSKQRTIRMEAEHYLRNNMSTFAAPTSNTFFVPQPTSPFINVYYGEDLLPSWALNDLPNLDEGEYQRTINQQRYHIIIRILPDGEHFYVLYNVTRLTASRESLLSLQMTILGVIIPIMFFGLILGVITAHKVITPLVDLADKIKSNGTNTPLPEDFAKNYRNDEIGFLAVTLKNTLDALYDSVAREAAFARDVSHELRTPVTTIKSSLELLETTDVNDVETVKKIRGRVRRATATMEHLIKSFLWLSRYEKIGEFDFEEDYTKTIITETIAEHMYLIGNKPIEVEVVESFSQKLPVAPQVMNIIISNLLRNAFTYTQQGKVSVIIEEKCIAVRDTGRGISKKQLSQLRKSCGKYHAEGFGFGISIVRRLCISLGWECFIDSQEGSGNCVKVCYRTKKGCGCESRKEQEREEFISTV